jgi:hypothetical protein
LGRIDTFIFSLQGFRIGGTWAKTKVGIIEHLTWPVNGWTLGKRFKKDVGNNQPL